ncbi:MAG TPA: bifunctional YncE family protein/alkaline phosphatase family protein [Gemmatimonadaceae bacterium]|nr:bifunctional YncE family protein/alkaline phosphatase family protein [Gemmatimonadaceae bacterium]
MPRQISGLAATRSVRAAVIALLTALLPGCHPLGGTASTPQRAEASRLRLPTGASLDPAAPSIDLGSMPLAMALSPDGEQVVVLLSGWREQGFQVVDRDAGRVTQRMEQPAAFLGVAFAPDGDELYASGGNQDMVYRYGWKNGHATRTDSVLLAPAEGRRTGRRYSSGLALSPDGKMLYVAENLADSLAVVDLARGKVVQHVPTGRYPYAVAVAPSGSVYVSAWGGNSVAVFGAGTDGLLTAHDSIVVGRHPSALLLNGDGSRLFAVSGSTDQIAVVDTRRRAVIARLDDGPPAGPGEGSTPNALALSGDGTRLYVAEADNNAVALFRLGAATSGVRSAAGTDSLLGRIPTDWYPTAVLVHHDTLLVVSGKGHGTESNPDGPTPLKPQSTNSRDYTLGQTAGTLMSVPLEAVTPTALASFSRRVAEANGWSGGSRAAPSYPSFEHVIYVIKENRTYDQVLGDLPEADGDTSLVFFPRPVSPNHHALAERFGIFDRFFVNAEVSPDGHNWSTAAYTTDYLQKTVPSNYSRRGRSYDYEGTNGGGSTVADIPEDDVNEPANGYLWDLASRAGITFRNYGEFVVDDTAEDSDGDRRYVGDKPFLRSHTNERYPGWDLDQTDQSRMDVWLEEFASFVKSGKMPALEIVRLPNDHTAGARAGAPTPRAYMADNDLALGRMIEALSRSPYWKSTVVFVLEDDAQNGPDHVDSHRSVLLAISPYNRKGVVHRFVNTTDVIATIGEILHLGSLSQFDYYGRPLRGIFEANPDLAPYSAIQPAVRIDERNPSGGIGALETEELDLSAEDRAEEDLFNRVLWRAIKGADVPYPGITVRPAIAWQHPQLLEPDPPGERRRQP